MLAIMQDIMCTSIGAFFRAKLFDWVCAHKVCALLIIFCSLYMAIYKFSHIYHCLLSIQGHFRFPFFCFVTR
jgi:hypothetical protein